MMQSYTITNYRDMEDMLENLGYCDLTLKNYNEVQLNSMQAWAYDGIIRKNETDDLVKVKVLQSYNTLVDIIIDGKPYRTKKYSTTISKQCTIFERYYC